MVKYRYSITTIFYRVSTNYSMILLDHSLSWKCAMIIKFMWNTTVWMYIWKPSPGKSIHHCLTKWCPSNRESWCALEFARSNSIVVVHQAFLQQFGCHGPPALSIWRWYEQFYDRGCICHQGKGCANIHCVEFDTNFNIMAHLHLKILSNKIFQ
jgi:hypothetical protein